jgi:hypothetical protein
MSQSPEESSSDFNEKTIVVESQGCVSEIDFTTYHEECAGRLVLDPKYVPSLIFSFLFFLPIISMQQGSMRRVWRYCRFALEAFTRRKDCALAAAKR